MEGLGDALVRREGRDVGEDGLEALGDVVQAGLVGQRLREQRLEGGWLDRVGDGVHGSGHRGDFLPVRFDVGRVSVCNLCERTGFFGGARRRRGAWEARGAARAARGAPRALGRR